MALGYYDGHQDAFISTDVSDKAEAASMHINYSPGLASLKAKDFAPIFMVNGTAATGQLMVFGSEPGENDYSPIWDEVMVTWKAGVTPSLLVKDDQINELAGKGMLTEKKTSILLNCPIIGVNTASPSQPAVDSGFYDGHHDAFVNTDVSDRSEASSRNLNFAPGLSALKASSFPGIYSVSGAAASGQLMVFGSQPGEDDYSPLWQEITVTWKAGATPVLLVKDDQIKQLASQGMLTMQATPVILNCPIIAVENG